jgi:hypothetical protein
MQQSETSHRFDLLMTPNKGKPVAINKLAAHDGNKILLLDVWTQLRHHWPAIVDIGICLGKSDWHIFYR